MVELATVGDALVVAGVVTGEVAAEAFGFVAGPGRFPGRGSIALGFRDSTLVFSRFTSSIRFCRLFPSSMACTALLSSAS